MFFFFQLLLAVYGRMTYYEMETESKESGCSLIKVVSQQISWRNEDKPKQYMRIIYVLNAIWTSHFLRTSVQH
jgi:hypothetical protein